MEPLLGRAMALEVGPTFYTAPSRRVREPHVRNNDERSDRTRMTRLV
jgi:hypothetical protein